MRPRALLLVFGLACLVMGAGAGISRAGVELPDAFAMASSFHAEILIGGFFGTVISLERAIALGGSAGYIVPLLAALGALSLVAGGPPPQALLAHAIAGAGLVAVSWSLQRRTPEFHARVLTLAAGAWLVGSLLRLAGASYDAALPWWVAFLVFTIAGERLELSRLMPRPPGTDRRFAAIAIAAVAAAPWVGLQPASGWRLFGASLLLLAVWLPRHDIARRTVHGIGLARYVAIALFCGYFWLATAGGLLLATGGAAGLFRDAWLHAVLLGFVFSMVFGHAPMIFPAVTGARMPWSGAFYAPLALLQATLLLRIGADLAGSFEWRATAAVANAAPLALFVAVVAGSLLRGALQRRS